MAILRNLVPLDTRRNQKGGQMNFPQDILVKVTQVKVTSAFKRTGSCACVASSALLEQKILPRWKPVLAQ